MKTKLFLCGLLLVGMNLGCPLQPPAAPPGPDGLSDTDGDGFFEIEPVEGEVFAGRIMVELLNEITREQLEALFSLDSNPLAGFALDAIDIMFAFDVTLQYPNGGERTFQDTKELGEFEIRVEADCPETITAVVTPEASVDLGPFGVQVLPLPPDFTLPPVVIEQGDGGFECDKIARLLVTFDEATGEPDVKFSVEEIADGG